MKRQVTISAQGGRVKTHEQVIGPPFQPVFLRTPAITPVFFTFSYSLGIFVLENVVFRDSSAPGGAGGPARKPWWGYPYPHFRYYL